MAEIRKNRNSETPASKKIRLLADYSSLTVSYDLPSIRSTKQVAHGHLLYVGRHDHKGIPRSIPLYLNKVQKIGRSRSCGLGQIHSELYKNLVSKKHVAIEMNENNGCVLTDLKSTNGVYVNGVRLVEGQQMLYPGDWIELGPSGHGAIIYEFDSTLLKTFKKHQIFN